MELVDRSPTRIDGTADPRGNAERYGPPEGAEKEKPGDRVLSNRLAHALVKGVVDFTEQDPEEALQQHPQPLQLIEGPLMAGAEHRRRPVRCPARCFSAGRQERTRDEEGVAHLQPTHQRGRRG